MFYVHLCVHLARNDDDDDDGGGGNDDNNDNGAIYVSRASRELRETYDGLYNMEERYSPCSHISFDNIYFMHKHTRDRREEGGGRGDLTPLLYAERPFPGASFLLSRN